MKLLDRYILRQFLVNYLVLFAVLSLLIVTLDLILNFDEFAQATEELSGLARVSGTLWLIADFYGPQLAMYYVYSAGILPIAAAGFTLAGLLRNRELIAMLAGGVSLYRVALPLLLAGTAASGLLFAVQEFVIPPLRHKLARSQSDLKHGGARNFEIQFVADQADFDGDGRWDRNLLFTARAFNSRTRTMEQVTILQRDTQGLASAKITAVQAVWDDERHAWRLIDGHAVERLDPNRLGGAAASMPTDPIPVEYVPSGLDPTTLLLHLNSRLTQLLSLRELNELLGRTTIIDHQAVQRVRHGRFSLMVINVLILAMGLPFYLLRSPANLLIQSVKAAPLTLGVWAGGFVLMQVGGPLPAAVSAWLPVLLYTPVALFMMDRIRT